MSFRVREIGTHLIICDGLSTHEEAWEIVEQSPNKKDLVIEEYKKPVKGLGRDPDLHQFI